MTDPLQNERWIQLPIPATKRHHHPWDSMTGMEGYRMQIWTEPYSTISSFRQRIFRHLSNLRLVLYSFLFFFWVLHEHLLTELARIRLN